MTKRRSKLLLASFLVLTMLFVLAGCDNDVTETAVTEMTITVQVVDENEDPIEGVALSLNDESDTTLEETSSSEGVAYFTAKLKENESYTIEATQDGYQPNNKEFVAGQGDVTITMSPKAGYAFVKTAAEMEAALNDDTVDTINLEANITGDFTLLRNAEINGGDYTLDGNLAIGDGSENLEVYINNLVETGTMTIDVADGSVYLSNVVVDEVVVESVGSNSLELLDDTSVGNLIVNGSDVRIEGGRKVIRAVVNGTNVVFDRPPQELDEEESDNTPEYEDASRFSVSSPGENEVDTPFALNITEAFNEDNNQLDGEYSVDVTSDIAGSIYSNPVTFIAGEASVELTLTDLGEHELTVEIENVTGSEAITVNLVLPPAKQPNSLSVTTQPTDTRAGEVLNVAVKVIDEYDRDVAGVEVSVGLNIGSFEEGTTTVTTDADGIATFDDLVLTTARNGYEMNFNVSGVNSVASNEFAINPGFADAANSSVSYGSGIEGMTLGAGVVGEIIYNFQDEYGNLLREGCQVVLSSTTLVGNFSLNSAMDNATSSPDDLNAEINSNGQVKVYIKSSITSNNTGEIGASIDGISLTTGTIEITLVQNINDVYTATEYYQPDATVTLDKAPIEGMTAWIAFSGTLVGGLDATKDNMTKLVGDGTKTVITAPTTEGVDYKVMLVDEFGNKSESSANLIVDGTAPSLFSLTISGFINIDTVGDYTVSGTTEADATVDVTLNDATNTVTGSGIAENDGSFSITVDASTLAEGSVNISVTATDNAGNTSIDTNTSVTKDTVAPSVNTVSIASNNTNDTTLAKAGDTVIFSVSFNEPVTATVTTATTAANVSTLAKDFDAASASFDTVEFTILSGASGSATIATADVTIKDAAGNTTPITSTELTITDGSSVTVDTAVPTFTASYNTTTTEITVVFNEVVDEISAETVGNYTYLYDGTSEEAVKTPTLQIDGKTVILKVTTAITANTGTIDASVDDLAGNTSVSKPVTL